MRNEEKEIGEKNKQMEKPDGSCPSACSNNVFACESEASGPITLLVFRTVQAFWRTLEGPRGRLDLGRCPWFDTTDPCNERREGEETSNTGPPGDSKQEEAQQEGGT